MVFDDGKGEGEKMWVIGGVWLGALPQNDVWSSTDGVTWNPVRATDEVNGFPKRRGQQSVVFDGGNGEKMWVIAGKEDQAGVGLVFVNDVWSSDDGITWDKETDSAQFSGRENFSSVVFNDRDGKKKIWVIGGIDGNNVRLNDVWSSANGKDWEKKTDNAEFSARTGHKSVVFDDKMWVIGGNSSGTINNDVWSSTNGVTWNEETDNNPRFTGRYHHASVVFNNRIWFIAGSESISRTVKNDVWSMKRD